MGLIPSAGAEWTPIIWPQAWRRRRYCRRGCTRFRYWHSRLHDWWQGMGYCGVLLGDRGTAGGAAGVLLGWGKRCWGAAGRRRSFTGRWHQWQGLLGCCWALLGPQLGFLLIPCCSDWSADGLGKLDVVASELVRDVCPPLRGPRLEDQLPVAPPLATEALGSLVHWHPSPGFADSSL